MRGFARAEKRRCGKSRDATHLGHAAVVRHSQTAARALRNRRDQLPPEYFAEIVALLFDRPQFQVNSQAPAGEERELDFGGAKSDADFLNGAAAAKVQGAS